MTTYWYRIDLDDAAGYQVWKPGSLEWARSIDWVAVNAAALGLLTSIGPTGNYQSASRSASYDGVREGLEALVYDPMDIEDGEVYNGGHRAVAMQEQGQRYTLGHHYEAD